VRRLAAALLTTTLLLAGCGGDGGTDDQPDGGAEGDLGTLQAVQIEGDPGTEPTVTFDTPLQVSEPVAWVESEGDGEPLEEGQSVGLHYVALSGDDGSELGSTWQDGRPERVTLGDPQYLQPLNDALTGQSVGARIVFGIPGGGGEGAEQSEQAEQFPATLMVIDVVDTRTIPDRAEGTPVEPAEGLPEVELAEDGTPTVTIPEGAEEPEELVVQTLIEGDGPEVESGQNITVQYHGVLWSDGSVFDSSWERGSPAQFGIGVGQVIPGWDQGLVGQTVGSQVLLVIPAELAYGDQDRPGIPADSTLVFVVDILDAA
jgi:peptidylprolyl isomerase